MKNRATYILTTVFFPVIILAGIIRVPQDQESIQAGINAAVSGDTVLVADSTYYENINFQGKAVIVASYFLLENDSVHIDSTIIDGSLLIVHLLLGFRRLREVDYYRDDPLVLRLMGLRRLPDVSTISRALSHMEIDAFDNLRVLSRSLVI